MRPQMAGVKLAAESREADGRLGERIDSQNEHRNTGIGNGRVLSAIRPNAR